MKKIKLNFGCGNKILDGYLNFDINPLDVRVLPIDLNVLPLPFEDGFADEILLSSILEHLVNPYYFVVDCHRVLKTGGVLRVVLPSNSVRLVHLRSHHTRDYFDGICRLSGTGQGGLLFRKESVTGRVRGYNVIVKRFLDFVHSFMVTEYEYELVKEG